MAPALGRALRTRFLSDPAARWTLAAAGLLSLAVLLPVAALGGELLSGTESLRHAAEVLGGPPTWVLLARSVTLALSASIVALVVGLPLGVLLGRTDVPGRLWALVVHTFPVFVPPFLSALGWFYLFGRSGLLGSDLSARLLFGWGGATAVLGLTFAPIVTGLTALALQGVDPSLEEAARVAASPGRVVRRVLLPVAQPAVGLALLLVFALAFSELAVPMFLQVRVYPAAVFARLAGIDYAPGEAVALAFPLLVVTAILVVCERRFLGERPYAVLGLRMGERMVYPLGRWRWAVTGACWCAALVSAAPILALVWRAGWQGLAQAPTWMGGSLWNGLGAAALAAAAVVGLGLTAAWAVARQRAGAAVIDATLMVGFLTPAAVLGVGIITVWNRPSTQAIYGSLAVVVLGLVARYAAVGVRALTVVIRQSPLHWEDAAAVFGARFGRRMRRIVLPLHARGIAAAGLFTLVFCLRDLDTVILFYPPGREPLPVRIFTLEANGPETVVAGLAVVQVAVTAVLLAFATLVITRQTRR